MSEPKGFIPDWTEAAPPAGSYRSIFKWGFPGEFKHPSDAWYRMLKEEFGMADDDFRKRRLEGLARVSIDEKAIIIDKSDITSFEAMVGGENVATDGYSRLKDPVTHRRTVTLDGPTGTLTMAGTATGAE